MTSVDGNVRQQLNNKITLPVFWDDILLDSMLVKYSPHRHEHAQQAAMTVPTNIYFYSLVTSAAATRSQVRTVSESVFQDLRWLCLSEGKLRLSLSLSFPPFRPPFIMMLTQKEFRIIFRSRVPVENSLDRQDPIVSDVDHNFQKLRRVFNIVEIAIIM